MFRSPLFKTSLKNYRIFKKLFVLLWHNDCVFDIQLGLFETSVSSKSLYRQVLNGRLVRYKEVDKPAAMGIFHATHGHPP